MYRDRVLEGKAVLVFGGSRGIGAAIARRLAKAGANVALTYVSGAERAADVVREIEGEGRRGFAIRADSAEASDIFSAVDGAVQQLGRLDVVVVNAGVLALGAINDFTLADLDRSIAVNLRGVFLAIQAVQRRMAAGGRIITIGSNAASLTAPGASAYSMTKAAVAAMVKGIAIDLAPRDITVNNIQPGPTLTDMTASLIGHVLPMIPLKRVAAPNEIAELALYLAGETSGYMTGASLTIDGECHFSSPPRLTTVKEYVDASSPRDHSDVSLGTRPSRSSSYHRQSHGCWYTELLQSLPVGTGRSPKWLVTVKWRTLNSSRLDRSCTAAAIFGRVETMRMYQHTLAGPN